MGRPTTNNPRPIPSRTCGCDGCLAKYPGDRAAVEEHEGSWQARYTAPGGHRIHVTCETEDEGIAALERARTQIRDRTWIDPKRAEITLCAWHGLWWPTQAARLDDNTEDRDSRAWRNHIEPAFGSWRLYELGWLEIQNWVNSLWDQNGGPLAASSVPKTFQILDRMLEAAKLDRRIPFNPADGVKLPKIAKKHPEDRRPPTYDMLASIRKHLPIYMRALQIVAQETGLRWGELAGLRWCRVDFKNRLLHVREVLTEVRGKIRRKAYPKSDAGLRTVPLTRLAVRALRWLLDREPDASLNESAPEDGLCENELIFHGRNRKNRQGEPYRAPLRRSAFRRLWIAAIEAAGVARKTIKKVVETVKDKVTGRLRQAIKERIDWWPDFHDQRHSYASRLHDRGVPEAIVQEILGHERAGTVTWLYTHAATNYAGQVLAALDEQEEVTQDALDLVA
ncbi:tyrosine-type recombinase/integrase [Streptomyces sp. NPDC048696]|uniref:tyrosine-type recombinase/integrase n=1 Tax=Streptomyces sp. NPDC048696 TaxID=3365585 RepID=UPI00371C1A94